MLTPHQQDVLGQSLKILKTNRFLIIKGSAGVGKTYLVNELIKNFRGKIYCSAPTNKAVAVLKGKVDNEDANFITTHKAMKMKRSINSKTGKIFFTPKYNTGEPPLDGVSYLIIDETSMINSKMLEAIEIAAVEQNCKVIFIGDDKQINPVGEATSPIFTRPFATVELTEIIRQGEGNPIIDLSRNLQQINTLKNDVKEGIGYLHTKNRQYIINKLAEINGTDELKYLAYTNKEVNYMNTAVRNTIYDNPNKIELGESLVFDSPYQREYYTNEVIRVEKLKIIKKEFGVFGKNGYKSVKLKCYEITTDKTKVIIIHEDDENKYNNIVEGLIKAAKFRQIHWREYYNFIEQFAHTKYNHAITVHKSQGSTYTKTIINIDDINRCFKKVEKDRLLYTAITRASELLVIFNE